ncbi:MAG: hypothetical protein R2849_12080 [Thermomicrobiales bacterium]
MRRWRRADPGDAAGGRPAPADLAQNACWRRFAQARYRGLDAATRRQLERGSRMTEMLKQPQFQPLPVENQVAVLFAASRGFVDDIPVDQIQAFRSDTEYMESSHRGLLDQIVEKGRIDDDLEEAGCRTRCATSSRRTQHRCGHAGRPIEQGEDRSLSGDDKRDSPSNPIDR